MRREAQLSSYIENTYASYEQIAIADQDEHKRGDANDDVRETLNAEHAIEVGIDAVFKNGYPVTNNLLRQMHRVLLDGARGDGAQAASEESRFTSEKNTRALPGPVLFRLLRIC